MNTKPREHFSIMVMGLSTLAFIKLGIPINAVGMQITLNPMMRPIALENVMFFFCIIKFSSYFYINNKERHKKN